MSNQSNLDQIRRDTLKSMDRNEQWFKTMLAICGVAEVGGLVIVLWLMNWSDPTHRLVFAVTMLVWVNLFLWIYTLAVRNRVGEQRILRAIEVLTDNNNGDEIS